MRQMRQKREANLSATVVGVVTIDIVRGSSLCLRAKRALKRTLMLLLMLLRKVDFRLIFLIGKFGGNGGSGGMPIWVCIAKAYALLNGAYGMYPVPTKIIQQAVSEWVTFCQNICLLFGAVDVNHFGGEKWLKLLMNGWKSICRVNRK